MAVNGSTHDRETARQAMPAAVRVLLWGALGALLASTLYLIAVRGDALLLDLAKLGRVFCF